jgi:TRAP-type C4-dicarboxylate transport system substrate-binding protein
MAIIFVLLIVFPIHSKVFKIATLSPDGSVWMEKMREGAQLVAKKTENRVIFKFYPGGVMGSDQAVLRKMRIGQLQGGAVVAGSISHIYPDSMIYGLPFIFRSFEEVDYVRERMDPILEKGYEDNGFVTFGFAEGGFVYVMSNAPVRTVQDLRHRKLWIPDNDYTSLQTVKALGIMPIPLGIGEVRTGLQTGLIDTVGTSPIGAVVLQWHTTQLDFLMDIPLMYIYGVLIIDKNDFSKLLTEDQNTVRTIMNNIFHQLNNVNREDNIQAKEALRNQGIQFIEPSRQTIEKWKETVSHLPQKLIEQNRLSPEILKTLKHHLNQYRTQQAGVKDQ